jgi:hypothetical protein
MKSLPNLIVLLVLLLSTPVLLYYMVVKTYSDKSTEHAPSAPPAFENTILVKDAEISRLKKENSLLKSENSELRRQNSQLRDRQTSPLSQPPRRF